MSISSRSYVNRYTPSNRFPLGVKWLLIVNVAIFLLSWMFPPVADVLRMLDLRPNLAVGHLQLWRIATYMFVHTRLMSLVWNMLTVWMFGSELERTWGTEKFLRYYLSCGAIAGIAVILVTYLTGTQAIAIESCAGAVYGLLAAYAIVFPDNTLLFGFLIPMKSKYFVLIIGAIVFFQTFRSSIADTALLTGMVAGYLLLRGQRLNSQAREQLSFSYKDWKLKRAKRKFEVYLKKRDSKSGPWVN